MLTTLSAAGLAAGSRVIIEKPLSVPAEGGMDMDGAVQEAARQFGTLLEGYIRRYPAEWRDWKNLKLPA